MTTRVYIAGPMTGLPDLNRPAFEAAAAQVRALGMDPVTPFDVADPALGYRECLALDLRHILRFGDLVVALDGWQQSPGARAEIAAAEAGKIPWTTLRDLLRKSALGGVSAGSPPADPPR